MTIRFLLASFISITLGACSLFPDPSMKLERTYYSQVTGWEKADPRPSMRALSESCNKLQTQGTRGPINTTPEAWQHLCQTLEEYLAVEVTATSARHFFESYFTPMQATAIGARDTGLITGYYELELEGSKTPDATYKYPLYRLPSEELRGASHEEIDAGALQGKGLELVYVKDPVRRFFLHIQGSGRVRLKEGGVMRVGYAGKNGQKYVAIGKMLIDEWHLKKSEVTAPAIMQWLYKHPEEMFRVMHENPSYVYFRELAHLEPQQGPIGAEGVPLTPGYSLAVDKRLMSYGLPVWLETALPNPSGDERPHKRLMIAQDTGGAIRKPMRGDIFFGWGEDAEWLAGHMKQRGKWVVLLPNGVVRKRTR